MQTTLASAAVTKPLESIALAAQRVNSATVDIQRFLDRFHGDQANELAKDGPMAPDLTHHAASLERLFSALDRLEIRISMLSELG